MNKTIRENITPRGDGNFISASDKLSNFNKREYNSERRRKLFIIPKSIIFFVEIIRENITPRGDGNYFTSL